MHPFPESQSSLLLRHLSPSGSPGKELRAWGPMTREGVAEGGHCPLGRRDLPDQSTAEHLEAGSQTAFHLLFFPPGASCPKGGWRGVMGDFLTSTNKSFHCRWPGSTSRPDRPGRWAITEGDSNAACRGSSPLVPSKFSARATVQRDGEIKREYDYYADGGRFLLKRDRPRDMWETPPNHFECRFGKNNRYYFGISKKKSEELWEMDECLDLKSFDPEESEISDIFDAFPCNVFGNSLADLIDTRMESGFSGAAREAP